MIQEYRPELSGVTKARVLLVGPVGAGKSSFFNSINSVFRGHMTSQAISGVCGKSVTTQVRTREGGLTWGADVSIQRAEIFSCGIKRLKEQLH